MAVFHRIKYNTQQYRVYYVSVQEYTERNVNYPDSWSTCVLPPLGPTSLILRLMAV